jgi:asparagine synthase (glutamine-hydrolysing)
MILRQAMEGILPDPVRWRRDKHNFIPFLVRGMLQHHRALLDQVLLEDTHDIGGYVNLAAVAAAYRRIAAQQEAAHGYDVQAVWRTVALALWLRQLRDASRSVKAVA